MKDRGIISRIEHRTGTSILSFVLLSIIVMYALEYCVVFIGGPSFYGDDTTYLSLAYNMISGPFRESQYIFSIRLMQIVPIAAFYHLFGINLFSSSAWDVLSFLGSIVIAFYVGKELVDERAGLISALLMAFFPTVVVLAPTISDDITMMFLTSLAMLSLLYGQKYRSQKWMFLCGTLLVASPLTSPEGAIIIVVAAAYFLGELLRGRIGARMAIGVVCGIIAAGALLMLANFLLSGNPLITYTTTSEFYSAVGVRGPGNTYLTIPTTDTSLGFYIKNMFPYNIASTLYSSLASLDLNPIDIWNHIYLINYNQVGFFFYAALFAGIFLVYLALFKKDGRAYFALFWLVGSFLYLEFGPMSISLSPFHYLLAYRLQRFLTIIAVPTTVVIGIAMSEAMRSKGFMRRPAQTVVVLAIVFLIATAIQINYFWYNILYVERYDQLAIANYLNRLPNNTPIYAQSSVSSLPIYMAFNNMSRFYIYDDIKNCTDIPRGAYVAIPTYENGLGLSYVPNPLIDCPYWEIVLPSPIFSSMPEQVTTAAIPFRVSLYYVPENASNTIG